MIQSTKYDRATGKYVKTMIPQSKEHADRLNRINTHMAKRKEPNEQEKKDYQKKVGRAYND